MIMIKAYQEKVKHMKKMTRREVRIHRKQTILDFIEKYRKEFLISPTMDEIAEAVRGNAKDAGNVSIWIKQLIEEGWLRRVRKGARVLVLTQPQPSERYEEKELITNNS
jgi:SOS-response transcriptional repressor LexA